MALSERNWAIARKSFDFPRYNGPMTQLVAKEECVIPFSEANGTAAMSEVVMIGGKACR